MPGKYHESEVFDDGEEPMEESVSSPDLDKLLYRIGQCTDYQCLYALEESFNKCGLTVQASSNSRMILCKLRDGKPITEHVIDDYLFIGSIGEKAKELTDRVVEKVCDFVRTNAGKPSRVENVARVWRNGLRMYESTIRIMNEDVQEIAGDMLLG
jgi:hypothetical protein